ncbi:right-handed parallel beta-helix repeat-containing protein [Paenibacillus sp. PAMC21692]|uniref:right-handed parallel beta-helix repeat-containing protein n=1 Tax=Paenibacillus sp. PAMC21692 TaxID=2762320 RepID=UPI00164DF3FB|nr:glycosyl hydrolase family 28-related protein [Paenibacillus sp. PAMC21692]QNK57250.1 right-handed parallel beta-helix repeat-containing protein [Paenibacillus sp. PAMC21692]
MMEKQKVESAESQHQEQEKGQISRRKLLASLGIAGVALASSGLITGMPVKAYAAPGDNRSKVKDLMNLELVVTTTVAELRANTQPAAELVYYVKDSGMEGAFYYDAADTSTPDNTGIVLVSTSGARFKRIFDGPVHVKWFGTKGDGVTDDTDLIQKALAYCQIHRCNLLFASGTYLITSSLLVESIDILGSPGTVIKKGGNHAVFFHLFLCGGESVTIQNIIFDGNRDNLQSHWRYKGDQFGFKTVNIINNYAAIKSYAGNTLIDNCSFRNIHGDGFFAEVNRTVFVRESRFENIAQNAVWTWNCKNVHVHDCHFQDIGILPEEFYVEGAAASFSGVDKWNHEYGDGAYCFAERGTIANNTFVNINRIAIVGERFTEIEPDITVSGNVIEHNHPRLRCNNPASSIWMEHVKKATVTGNTTLLIQRDVEELIVSDIVLAVNPFERSEYTVTGNICDSSGFNRVHASSIVLWTTPGMSCTIAGNIIRSKSDQAILIGNASANNLMINNNDVINFNTDQSSCIKFLQSGSDPFCKNLTVKDNTLKQFSNSDQGRFYSMTFAHNDPIDLTDAAVMISGNNFNGGKLYIAATAIEALAIEANRNLELIQMLGQKGANKLIIHDNDVNDIVLNPLNGSNKSAYITGNYFKSMYVNGIDDIFVQNNIIRTPSNGIFIQNRPYLGNLIRIIGNTIDLLNADAIAINLDNVNGEDARRAVICQNVVLGNGHGVTTGVKWSSADLVNTPLFTGNIFDRVTSEVVRV